jgi:sugar phosphate isomerase/epimerase
MKTGRDFLTTPVACRAFSALTEVGYRGWTIVELDAVPDQGGTASASMLTSKRYIEPVLELAL